MSRLTRGERSYNCLAEQPLLLENIDVVRERLARAERDEICLGRVWQSVRRRCQASPDAYPWFTPFVAMMTQAPSDIEAARQAIRRYVDTLDVQSLGSGAQFHHWCFAFPHARWTLYFQWLDTLGAWDEAEYQTLREQLITFQFVNFFYGMRIKPEPETVDNQAMSLCMSNAMFGLLFGRGDAGSAMARRMGIDGLRRLPSMLGGMPPCGYSGEGSTYMDAVVGPSIPFIVELMERAEGGDWYSRELPPRGGSAANIIRMIAREWMPGGLLLPWDHYGFSLPLRAAIAYGAHRTGDPMYLDLLEHHANWGHDPQAGWGYDDPIWSLIWWPDRSADRTTRTFAAWCEPTIGATLVSDDAQRYIMQMWDRSEPSYPTRQHVNPNSIILNAFGTPLTIDGIPDKSCDVFMYEDTWRALNGHDFVAGRTNFGNGCAGSHSVLIVDGRDSMHAHRASEQAYMVSYDNDEVITDVTAQYAEHWPDARMIRRRTRLIDNECWLIEDLAAFDEPHDVAARWYLRPGEVDAAKGVAIETAEGVRLNLMPLLGPDQHRAVSIEGYPRQMDGRSLRVDFSQRGETCRWLWLAYPQQTRRVTCDVADGWRVAPDAEQTWALDDARAALDRSSCTLPLTLPAFFLAEVSVTQRWWYRQVIDAAPSDTWWLRLPRRMIEPRLWINGVDFDLAAHSPRMDLMQPHIRMPEDVRGPVEIILRVDVSCRQYDPKQHESGGGGFSGAPAVLESFPAQDIGDTSYTNSVARWRVGERVWEVPHELMQCESEHAQ